MVRSGLLERWNILIRIPLVTRWSLIAGRVPGRTDNQVKNHWNTHLSKKLGLERRKRGSNIPPSKSEGAEGNPSARPSLRSEKPIGNEGAGDLEPPAAHDGSHATAGFDFSSKVVAIDDATCDQMGYFCPFLYEDMSFYAPPDVTHYMGWVCSLGFHLARFMKEVSAIQDYCWLWMPTVLNLCKALIPIISNGKNNIPFLLPYPSTQWGWTLICFVMSTTNSFWSIERMDGIICIICDAE